MREPAVLVRIAAALDGSFKSAFSTTEKHLAKMREEISSLEKTGGKLNSFRSLSLASEKAKISLRKEEEALKNLTEKIKVSGSATEIQSRRMSYLGSSIESTKHKIESQTKSLEAYRKSIHEAGLSTESFHDSEKKLASALSSLRTKELNILAADSKRRDYNQARGIYQDKKSDLQRALFSTIAATAALAASPIQYQHQLTRLIAASKDRTKTQTGEEQEKLSEELERITLGISLKMPFSATGVAKEATELAQAGFSPKELAANLPQIFKMSQATDTPADEVSRMMQNFKSSFQLDAGSPEEMNILANSLAKAVNIGTLTMSDLKESSAYLVDLPKTFNVSLGDTLAAMATVRDRGISGSMLGTSLGALFTMLSKPKTQRKLQDELDVSTTEKKGGRNFIKPFFKILEDIEKATRKMGNADELAKKVTIFKTEAGRPLGAMIQDLRDKNSRLHFYAENLKVKDRLKSPDEMHLELNYLDQLAGDLRKSTLNSLTQTLTSLQVSAIRLFETIQPEVLSTTNALNACLQSFSSFLEESPIIAKGITLITGSFVGLSLALKTFSLLKAARLLVGVGSMGAVATASSTLGLSVLGTAGYLAWKNWGKVPGMVKKAGSNFFHAQDAENDTGLSFLVPKTESRPRHIEDKRSYVFNMQLPNSSDPQSYVRAVRDELVRKPSILNAKPSPFFDPAGAW